MIERWKPDHKQNYHIRMLECPACGIDLRNKIPARHLESHHVPSDFGLSPLKSTLATDGGDSEIKGDRPQGYCDVCGREIGENSDRCADCIADSKDTTTLADFGGGLS